MNRRPLVYSLVTAALVGPLLVLAHAAPGVATPLCGEAAGAKGRAPFIGKESRRPLRVASFNTLHNLTAEGDRTLGARQELAIAQLAAATVDVVGLQEVSDSAKHGEIYREYAAGLAKATGYTWFWCYFRAFPHIPGEPETRDGGGGPLSDMAAAQSNENDTRWYEGGAILSRYYIIRGDAHRLPGEETARIASDCLGELPDPTCVLEVAFESRVAVWARISTPIGIVDMATAHTSGTVAQHRDLTTWLASVSTAASAYLVCDCNALESSTAMATIRDAGWVDTYRKLNKDAGPTADQTVTARGPTVTQRIDYLFHRTKNAMPLLTSTRFLNRRGNTPLGSLYPSDHYGLLATFEGPPGPFGPGTL